MGRGGTAILGGGCPFGLISACWDLDNAGLFGDVGGGSGPLVNLGPGIVSGDGP